MGILLREMSVKECSMAGRKRYNGTTPMKSVTAR